MKKSEMLAYDNDQLITALYWIAVRTTNEVNSRRGLTKQTAKEEEWILDECAKRFGLDIEKLKNAIIDR